MLAAGQHQHPGRRQPGQPALAAVAALAHLGLAVDAEHDAPRQRLLQARQQVGESLHNRPDEEVRSACIDVFRASQTHPERRRVAVVAACSPRTAAIYRAQAAAHGIEPAQAGTPVSSPTA